MHLGRLALAYRAAVTARLGDHPVLEELRLRPPSMGTLRVIGAFGPVSQREVAERLSAHASDMVAVIDQLEGYGLVLRERSAVDRRRYDLTLTARGEQVRDAFAEVTREVDDEFYGALTPREQASLRRLLDKLVTAHGV